MRASYTIEEVAKSINGEVCSQFFNQIENMASLSLAKENSIACFSNISQLDQLKLTKAGVILTTSSLVKHCHVPCITVVCVFSVTSRLRSLFSYKSHLREIDNSAPSIHKSAQIASSAQLGTGVTIGANVVIADHAIIENGCIIEHSSTIGACSVLFDGVVIKSGVHIASNSIIGSQSRVDMGAIIGSNPYDPIKVKGRWSLSSKIGRVVIGQAATIGANTTIDAGAHSDTNIGDDVHIDNLVQIAHDVTINKHTVIAAAAIIGANSNIGKHCTIGGGCAIAGQLKLVDDVVLTGRTTVSRSILKSGVYSSGITAQPHEQWRRNLARFHRLNDSIKQLKTLKNWVVKMRETLYE